MPSQEVTPWTLFHWDRRFVVPDFQRPFSWGAEEVKELWDDLLPVVNGAQRELFLGTIVLETSQPGKAIIWDGQQRIASLVMLLAACRDRLLSSQTDQDPTLAAEINTAILGSSLAPSQTPAITMGDLDDRTFREFALLPAGDPNKRDEAFWRGVPVTRRRSEWSPKVVEVFESIRTTVGDFANSGSRSFGSERDAIRTLVYAILNKIRLVKFETVSEEEAFRLFEVLNDRGLELSAADLIKNFLLSRAGPNQRLRTEMKSEWDRMSRSVGSSRLTAFLRHFYMARFGKSTKADLYDRVVALCSGPPATAIPVEQFLAEALDASELYARVTGLSQPGWASAGMIEALDTLNRVGATQWTPLILSAYALGLGDADFEEIVRAASSLFIRNVIVGGRNPNSLERLFGDAATKLWKACRMGTPPTPPSQALKSAIDSIKQATLSDADFKDRFLELADLSGPTTKLILEKLEKQVQRERKGGVVPQLSILDMEHIYPRTDGPDWPSPGLTDYVDEASREMLGNLTLLHLTRNRQQKNAGFAAKKVVYASSSLEITKEIARFTVWNLDSIRQRQRELADIALRTWT